MMTVRLVNDIYPFIYQWLDPPSKAMFAFACKQFLKLGIPKNTRGYVLIRKSSLLGHLKIIQWVRQYGTPWSVLACEYAAGAGHLETLKWLIKNGCYLDNATCYYATKNGHLEVLIWLWENKCPWNYGVFKDITNPKIIDWAKCNNCFEV